MDEFMELAGEWGVEPPDDLAEAVAGGGCSWEKVLMIANKFL